MYYIHVAGGNRGNRGYVFFIAKTEKTPRRPLPEPAITTVLNILTSLSMGIVEKK